MKRTTQISILSLIIILFISCERENLDNELPKELSSDNLKEVSNDKSDERKRVIQKIELLGFNTENLQEYGDYFIVENDILLSKKLSDYDQIEPEPKGSTKTEKHARTLNLVNETFRVVTIGVHSSIPNIGSDNWSSEIDMAISNWNSISDCSIAFARIYDPNPDILIRSDQGTLPSGVYASASFPYNGIAGADNRFGLIGGEIYLNLDFGGIDTIPVNATISQSLKMRVIMHELGHTIGFRHTNTWPYEIDPGIGAIGIPGTPATNDSSSIMFSNIPYQSTVSTNFSSYDKIAAKTIYPPISCNFRLAGPANECAYEKYGGFIEYNVYALDGDEITGTSNWSVSGNEIEIVNTQRYACKVRAKPTVTNWPATGTVTLVNNGCTKKFEVTLNDCVDYSYSD